MERPGKMCPCARLTAQSSGQSTSPRSTKTTRGVCLNGESDSPTRRCMFFDVRHHKTVDESLRAQVEFRKDPLELCSILLPDSRSDF